MFFTYFIKLWNIIWFVWWCHCSFMSLFTLWNKHNIQQTNAHMPITRWKKFSIKIIFLLYLHSLPFRYISIFFYPTTYILYMYRILFIGIRKTNMKHEIHTSLPWFIAVYQKFSGIWMTQYLLIKVKNKMWKSNCCCWKLFFLFFLLLFSPSVFFLHFWLIFPWLIINIRCL